MPACALCVCPGVCVSVLIISDPPVVPLVENSRYRIVKLVSTQTVKLGLHNCTE